jgi:hypothetical protein
MPVSFAPFAHKHKQKLAAMHIFPRLPCKFASALSVCINKYSSSSERLPPKYKVAATTITAIIGIKK